MLYLTKKNISLLITVSKYKNSNLDLSDEPMSQGNIFMSGPGLVMSGFTGEETNKVH